MDQGAGNTQKLVIILSILLAFLLIFYFGFSLWKRAQDAKAALAQKEELERKIKQEEEINISITNEANNPSDFSYESLTQNTNSILNASSSDFSILATNAEEENLNPVATKTAPKVVKKYYPVKKKVYVNTDRPLTAEEIRRIRMLPVDTSATGNLQNKLEDETEGKYKAQYK